MSEAATSQHSMAPFHAIVLDGVGTIVFTQSADATWSVTGNDGQELLDVDVRDQTLHIDMATRTIRIYSDADR